MELGTPFMSSLTTQQLELYKESKAQRRRIFYSSFAGAFVACSVLYFYWLR